MTAQTRRRIFVIAVGILVAAAVIRGFMPKPVVIDTAPAARGALQVTVEEEGRTRVKDRFVVSAPVSGYLRRIQLEAGNTVGRGQQVALLEPLRPAVLDPRSRAEAEASEASARAAFEAAKERARAAAADAEYSREREARFRKLAASDFISKDDLDQAVAESRKAGANLLSANSAAAAAKADFERAQAVLRYSAEIPAPAEGRTVVVRAPAGGRVLRLVRESEGVVSAGEPLVEIGNPASLEVKAEVLSADAVKLHQGTAVLFTRWGGEGTLEGRVRTIEPAGFTKISSLGVEEQRVNVIADISSPVELWQKLGDGYRLDATFIVWEGKDVLQVPAGSLFRKGEGWALFVVENKRARMRDVEIGRRNGLSAEIVKGIPEGAIVITNPEDNVLDGVRVKAR